MKKRSLGRLKKTVDIFVNGEVRITFALFRSKIYL